MATVFGIQDAGDGFFEFLQLRTSDDIDKLEINDVIFAIMLMIDQQAMKWQEVFEIQMGVDRHLEF